MRHKTKIAAVGALMLAGLASGVTTASATPEANFGVQADCQTFGIKRTPPASAIGHCNSLDPGYNRFRTYVECADGQLHYGATVRPQQISTARCPANVYMTSNGPWIQQLV